MQKLGVAFGAALQHNHQHINIITTSHTKSRWDIFLHTTAVVNTGPTYSYVGVSHLIRNSSPAACPALSIHCSREDYIGVK